MKRAIALLTAALALAGCTFDPAYDVTCLDENAEVGGKICKGGVWVATGAVEPDAGQQDTSTVCVPESDSDLCNRNEANCGSAQYTDNCGAARTVQCGTCAGGSTCGTESPNVCFCPGETQDDLCTARKACGILEVVDQCGNTVPIACEGCDGVATCVDNSCTCDVTGACEALDANCGTVDVTDQCAGTTSIVCGDPECGENSSCGDDNKCACDRGFSGDGTNCVDVDECAIGTSDCDPNADCVNMSPGYDCTCRDGFDGDGKTCESNVQIVTAVRNVLVNMDNVDATTTYAPIVAANSVPFVTRYVRDTGEEGDRLALDVMLPADGEVRVERQDNLGSVTAAVSVVEFDPAHVRVQSGTFAFGGETTDVTLSSPVDTTKAFIVFYYQRDNNQDNRKDLFIAAEFANNGEEIHFERGAMAGNVSGHYWVVEALGTQFEVQQVAGDLIGTAVVNIPISQVDPARSMAIFSSFNNVGNEAGGRSNVRCTLAATNVKCQRDSGNDDAFAKVQVVSFNTNISVQRGELDFGGTEGEKVASIANVDDTATAFGGAVGMAGTQEQASSGESPGGFFATTIVSNGTEVKVQRGVPRTSAAKASWQVIDW